MLSRLFHPRPKLRCSFWSVATLRHHEKPNVVRFSLVFARRRHREKEVEEHLAGVEGNVECGESKDAKENERSLGHAFTV